MNSYTVRGSTLVWVGEGTKSIRKERLQRGRGNFTVTGIFFDCGDHFTSYICIYIYTCDNKFHFNCVCLVSPIRIFGIPWTVAHQAPLSMGILHHQEYWSGLPCPLPIPGITSRSPALQAIYCLSHQGNP